jgi:hypothetical protein
MENIGALVRPDSHVIGSKQEIITNTMLKVQKPVMMPVTGLYVTITEMLTAVHAETDLIQQATIN